MPPTEAEQERARATLLREARWARLILFQMLYALGGGAYVLTHRSPDSLNIPMLEGAALAVLISLVLWLGQPAIRWLMVQVHLLWLLAVDGADHLLQRYLKHRAIRRRGSLGSPPISGGSSGSTSPRPDNGSGSEHAGD